METNNEWMNDPLVAGIDKAKLQFLQMLVFESQNLTKEQMLPFLMSVAQKGKANHISFDDRETEALRKKHKVKASYADIAAAVGCSERQAIRAVKWLMKHKYIHRPKDDKGISSTHKSVYTLDHAYWRRKKRRETTPADVPEPEQTPEQKAAAVRQLWLKGVSERAKNEAERNAQRARRNERYMLAHSKVVAISISNPTTLLCLRIVRL